MSTNNYKDTLDKLKSLSISDKIKLKNVSTINVSDIEDIIKTVSYDDIISDACSTFDVSESVMSLGKFLDYIDLEHGHIISSTLHYSDARLAKSKNPIRNNGKWIYREILFKTPLKFTFVEFNNYIYVAEPMEQISSLISFISGVRPISDTLNVNNHEEIWWRSLDASTKERLLETPVTILKISNISQDDNKYLRLASSLFDIPQYVQLKLEEDE